MKALFGLLLFVVAHAQEFEAASVKPAAPPTAGRIMIGMQGGPGSPDPGRIRYSNVAMKELLARAYGVKNFQISGPSWMDSERFDITATMPPGTTKEQFEKMLQNLLADRFKLTLHHEQKDLPAYVLTVGKKGPKMKVSEEEPPVKPDDPPPPAPSIGKGDLKTGKDGFPEFPAGRRGGPMMIMMPGKAKMAGNGMTMQQLVDQLSRMLAKPVVDHTELTGKYDFVLYFAPEQTQIGGRGPGIIGPDGGSHESRIAADDAEPAPTILAAVQDQLGLKLDSQKASVDLLVIDRVERVPTEN